jgi:hypothetical protein
VIISAKLNIQEKGVIIMKNAAALSVQHGNPGCYTQVKVSVDSNLASAFKAACIASNVSMASKFTQFMAEYTKTAIKNKPSPDYSTRRKRRAAIKSVVKQLEKIKAAEERYIDNIPENLQNSAVFDAAEEYLSRLDEAIEILDSM